MLATFRIPRRSLIWGCPYLDLPHCLCAQDVSTVLANQEELSSKDRDGKQQFIAWCQECEAELRRLQQADFAANA